MASLLSVNQIWCRTVCLIQGYQGLKETKKLIEYGGCIFEVENMNYLVVREPK